MDTKTMKVFISRDIPASGIELLRQRGLEVTVCPVDRPLTQLELIEYVKKNDALLSMFSDSLDKYFFNECKHLKVISQFAVGYDNIDLAEATRLRIPIGNTPDVLSGATADVAFLLMMAVSRKAFYLHKTIARGEWGFFRPKANLGLELTGKTLGIFGLGRIGAEMAKRCHGAYNMKVIYYNRSRNLQAESLFRAQRVEFHELLAQSDVISVHSSLSDETKGVFNMAAFRQMKKTAIFINTARGMIHTEPDLIEALQNNLIWGAGLDVTNPEPMKPDNPLLTMERVAVLPHIGSAAVETRNEMARLCARNIIEGLEGKRVTCIVNPEIYERER
jgi:glyoxylate reductase